MKNKNLIILYLVFTIIVVSIYTCINIYEYHTYTYNYNLRLDRIITTIKNDYPDITDEEILNILNSEDNSNYMSQYGYNIYEDNYLKINNDKFNLFLILNIVYIIVSIIILLFITIYNNNRVNKEINNIRKLVEDINDKKYYLHLDESSEDVFSQLKSEVYKTTIVLKEAAENSSKAKKELKSSLENISHQLKTPLTSILIMLDNIIDDPDMDENIRTDFINDIKRETTNINFLVQNILKLSKLDSNTITFNKSKNKIIDIVNDSIKNINTLCDLKNINIITEGNNECNIYCDFKWQVEAVTNILKNAIDHSKESNKVIVKLDDNSVYSKIEIVNYGEEISEKDMHHIFERFYKGENAKSDSVGIGLALAKMIIEEDNGTISVSSNKKETKFTIKYYKI